MLNVDIHSKLTMIRNLGASILGFSVLGITALLGCAATIHFLIKTCCIESTTTSNTRLSKAFRFLCGLLMVAGSMELISIFVGYFVYSRVWNIDATIFGVIMITLHGICTFLLSFLFLLRLYGTLKGSIYDYPSRLYKILLVISSLNIIFALISLIIVNINSLLEDMYPDGHHHWYFTLIPELVPLIILPSCMFIYLVLQVVLVALLIKALKSVELFIIQLH